MTIDKNKFEELPIKILYDKENNQYFIPVINPATLETIGGIRPDGTSIVVDPETGIASTIETNIQSGNDVIDVTKTGNNVVITSTTYTHNQSAVSDRWVITHNLNKYPSVTTVDTAGTCFLGEIHYDSLNQCTVFLNSATSGKAYLN